MRYAIYFAAAADDQLMQLGNSWLGRNPFSGTPLPQPSLAGLSSETFRELTSSPRRYGFHGTLKAPFSLHADAREADLLQACEDFAGSIAPYEIQGLSVNRLGKFLALTPDRTEPSLSAFASLCVRRFEDLRAPLSEADLERRRQSNLTPKQDAYVEAWGYPYIFDEFRFHMTLSNKLDDEGQAGLLTAAATSHFDAVTSRLRICSSFALYVEPERGAPFDVHTLFDLTGSVSPLEAGTSDDRLTAKETA